MLRTDLTNQDILEGLEIEPRTCYPCFSEVQPNTEQNSLLLPLLLTDKIDEHHFGNLKGAKLFGRVITSEQA